MFPKNHLGYVVKAYVEHKEEVYESLTICEDDEITILHYHSFLDFAVEFQFNVIIGIGEFVKGKNLLFFKIEKCLAKLRYNPDLSLYDVEFYINENNKK